jgi:signal transduction histidine kinase
MYGGWLRSTLIRMSAAQVVTRMRARWARGGYLDFAWWIPMAMNSCAFGAAIVAVVQRAGVHPLPPVAAIAVVGVIPWAAALGGWRIPWPAFTAMTLGATTALIVLYPVDYDFGLFLTVMLAGHLAATESTGRSALATGVASVVLVTLDVLDQYDGSTFWLAALVVGWDVGFIMRYQQRRLDEEARLHREHEAAAILQERQRIAREVHDVVAHSLSVTMLHLTAARRSLEEDREAGIDEAIDALRDAESLGREAMTDIRTTVGLLGQESAPAAAPDLRDLPALVSDFRQAGMQVTLAVRGDPAAVPPNAGLSLYRIAQESLANVAKHEPGSRAEVDLDCSAEGQRLRVGNTRVLGRPRQGGGSGLTGMRQRAELLGGTFSAGPEGERWMVDVALPGRTTADEPASCSWGLRASADPA